jgi:cobalt-zinc-cadmium efflux system membrane fusion protein
MKPTTVTPLLFASASVLFVANLFIGCSDPQHVGDEEAIEQDNGHDHEADDTTTSTEVEDHTLSLIDLKTARASYIDVDEFIDATGTIINNQNNEIHVNAVVPGRVNEALADWGETVRKGQTLACIESIELGKKRADYERAIAELELAESEFKRIERLHDKDAVSERRFLEVKAELKSAQIDFQYAEKMLLLTGLNKDEILEPPDEHPTIPGCSFHLTSPIKGVVIERNVVRGEKIEPGTCVYKILDLSSVWVETDIFEKDLPRIKQSTRVQLTVPAFPNRTFTGKIIYLGATVDQSTRTVKMRSLVPNADLDLKPGMFAEVQIVVGSHKDVVGIPVEAILSDESEQYVFVKHGDHYDRKVVKTGAQTRDGLVAILSGVVEGQEVVVQGQHQIDSSLQMKGADPHAGHTH